MQEIWIELNSNTRQMTVIRHGVGMLTRLLLPTPAQRLVKLHDGEEFLEVDLSQVEL
jgi:hypothetical protein